jgi:peptidase M23-like protein
LLAPPAHPARVLRFEREPELLAEPFIRSHRTTARGVLLLLAIGFTAGSAAARPLARPKPKAVPSIIFPVVGSVFYYDDFGQPRGGHKHQGNDIMAARHSPAVAAEAGRIEFHTTSALAGCMLYLYGDSGTTYLYIHLNNDVTRRNDNRGTCVAGTAYWKGIKDGQQVSAGQPIAYVGDSGDADGTPHLHFEVHPNDGGAVNPFPYLNAAQRMLFVARLGSTVTLSMIGTFVSTTPGLLNLKVDGLRVLPGTTELKKLARPLMLSVPPDALVQRVLPNGLAGGSIALTEAKKGQRVTVLTQPVENTLEVELARDGVLSAASIFVG